jgi:hypothetical protein
LRTALARSPLSPVQNAPIAHHLSLLLESLGQRLDIRHLDEAGHLSAGPKAQKGGKNRAARNFTPSIAPFLELAAPRAQKKRQIRTPSRK